MDVVPLEVLPKSVNRAGDVTVEGTMLATAPWALLTLSHGRWAFRATSLPSFIQRLIREADSRWEELNVVGLRLGAVTCRCEGGRGGRGGGPRGSRRQMSC